MTLSLGASLLLACSSGADTANADITAPGAHTWTPGTTATVSVDLPAVEAALSDLLLSVRELNAAPVLAGYQAAMADADDTCPAYYEQDGNTFWYATCQAESGAEYDGYAFFTRYEQYDLFGDGTAWDADVLSASADITEADGDRLHVGGTAYLGESVIKEDVRGWISVVAGAFMGSGPDVSESWIGDGATPTLTSYAIRYELYDLNLLYLYGSIGLEGDLTAASFGPLFIYTQMAGVYPCAEEPAGSVSLRDPSGTWMDVVFDLDPETLELAEGRACDGCARVTVEGDEVGEICIDGSSMVDWTDAPW